MVFAVSEPTQSTVNDPCDYRRELTVIVKGLLKLPGTGDTYTVEDRMDECAAEIETKLTQSALRDEVQQIESFELVNTDIDVVIEDFEGGIDHGEVVTSWRVTYSTEEGSPETFI